MVNEMRLPHIYHVILRWQVCPLLWQRLLLGERKHQWILHGTRYSTDWKTNRDELNHRPEMVHRSTVSDRLIMLCVHPGIICTASILSPDTSNSTFKYGHEKAPCGCMVLISLLLFLQGLWKRHQQWCYPLIDVCLKITSQFVQKSHHRCCQ